MHNPLDRLDKLDGKLRNLHDAEMSRRGRIIWLVLLTMMGWAAMWLLGFREVPEGVSTAQVVWTSALFALLLTGSAVLLFRALARAKASFSLYLLLGTALLGIFVMRISFLSHRSGDYLYYLEPWAELMRGRSFSAAMSASLTEYNVPYQYLIFLISRIPLPTLYLYKWLSMAGDVLCAWLVLRIAQRIGMRGILGSSLMFLLVLSWPTFIINSAMWAQCDALYAGPALAGVYLATQKRPYLSALAFAFAIAFKLQAMFLLPILLVLWGTRDLELKHLLMVLVFYLAIMVPALLAGMPPIRILTVYTQQAQLYKDLVLGAPSMYQLLNPLGSQARMFFYFGLAAAAVAVLVLCAFALRYRTRLNHTLIIDISLLITLLMPFLLPRMHERYFYIAELCALAYVAVHPRRFPVAVLLLLASLNGYVFGLQEEFVFMPMRAGALLVLGLLCYLCLQLWRDMGQVAEEIPMTQG